MIIELHCHTNCSDGIPSARQLITCARQKGMALAITDHDTTEGYRKAKPLAKRLDVLLVPAAEITLPEGHVLAYGISSVPKRGGVEELIDDVHRQGGIAIAAHPFSVGKRIGFRKDFNRFDAIEVLNGLSFPWENAASRKAARSLHMPAVSGSDAHFLRDFGRFACDVDAESVDSALRAIKKGRVIVPAANTNTFNVIKLKTKKLIYKSPFFRKESPWGKK